MIVSPLPHVIEIPIKAVGGGTRFADSTAGGHSLPFYPKFGRTDIVMMKVLECRHLYRMPWFERFLRNAKGLYYIEIHFDENSEYGYWQQYAEFSDRDDAVMFNGLIGGRIHRNGEHAIGVR